MISARDGFTRKWGVCAKSHEQDCVQTGLDPDAKTISMRSDFLRILRRRLSAALDDASSGIVLIAVAER